MNIIPINYAQAIIEPLYDYGNFESKTEGHPLLKEYTFTGMNPYVDFKVTWCSLNISISKGEAHRPLAVMKRKCRLDLTDYNQFILFGSIPDNVMVSMEAEIDGEKQLILSEQSGLNTTGELRGLFHGHILTSIVITFSIKENKPCEIDLRWIGLSNTEREKELSKIKAVIDPSWPQYIKTDDYFIEPQMNLFFDQDDLINIRKDIQKEPFKTAFDRLRKQALKYLSLNPESVERHIHSTVDSLKKNEDLIPENMVSTYVPWGDRRWNLNSEMRFSKIDRQMEVLSFVGLVDENIDMCHLAVRMALSIAHCENWTESAMGKLPGTTWHHRSFTEAAYLKACSLVLDWAGFLLTEHGKDIILDAMVLKGLPRVESDFKRQEYIRFMNQGIHFNGGRLPAYICLSRKWPRYEEMVSVCKKDLFEMIDNYVLDDGGTLEGPAYWNYTFEEAVQEVYMLAKHEKRTLNEIASAKLIKTAAYGANMMSLINHGTMFLPVNDAHWDKNYHLGMTASFYLLSNNDQLRKIYFRMLKSNEIESDPFLFIAGNKMNDFDTDGEIDEWFNVLPDTGQVDFRINDKDFGMIHLHYITGPVYKGHCQADKGSFILETDQESLLIDRGILPYSHPDTMLMKYAINHNCLVPFDDDGDFYNQSIDLPGGKLSKAEFLNDTLQIVSDDTEAWGKELFKRCTREISSVNKREFIITDSGEITDKIKGFSFRLHTRNIIEKQKDGYIIIGNKCDLLVQPINYTSISDGYKKEGTDSESRDVNLLWFDIITEKKYIIRTRLLLIEKN
ncbi:MAG: heparinase II/III family protein [Clostridia bacterium]|nr:heparinase II/III family protein [Clostridia bacterium]